MSELVKHQKEDILNFYINGGIDQILSEIKNLAVIKNPSLDTAKSRQEFASLAAKVSKSKVYLDNIGKDLVADWKEKSKAVDGERKKARDFLDNLRDEVRKPLTNWENIEKDRISKIRAMLMKIDEFGSTFNKSLDQLSEQSKQLRELFTGFDFEEFENESIQKHQVATDNLNIAAMQLRQRIEQEKELEKLRAENERLERERAIREGAEQARKQAIAEAEAAEKRKLAAMQMEKEKIERERQAAIEAQKRAEAEAAELKRREEARMEVEKQRELAEKKRIEDQKKKIELMKSDTLSSIEEGWSLTELVNAIYAGKVKHIKVNY